MDLSNSNASEQQVAILGGGCFWCLEAVYQELEGVVEVVSGYAGGQDPNPTYEAVCGGQTGHAEVVRIKFDPSLITYRDLLEVFFVIHDPTTLNRQGHDVGTQYRSVIYANDQDQYKIAQTIVNELEFANAFPDRIVTEIEMVPTFFPAEAYHQNYYATHPYQGYCLAVIAPKLSKFRQKFQSKRKQAD